MNGHKVLAAEFAISASIITYGAVKEGYWPWPAAIARAAFAYAVLSIAALLDDRIAALLGAGFLIAQIVRSPVNDAGEFKFTGGIPKGIRYPLLGVGGPAKDQQVPSQSWKPPTAGGGIGRQVPIQQDGNNGGVVQV